MKRDDLKDLYLVLEELNHFFHQRNNYATTFQIRDFAEKIYPDVKRMYYETVWKMLPKELKEEFENR